MYYLVPLCAINYVLHVNWRQQIEDEWNGSGNGVNVCLVGMFVNRETNVSTGQIGLGMRCVCRIVGPNEINVQIQAGILHLGQRASPQNELIVEGCYLANVIVRLYMLYSEFSTGNHGKSPFTFSVAAHKSGSRRSSTRMTFNILKTKRTIHCRARDKVAMKWAGLAWGWGGRWPETLIMRYCRRKMSSRGESNIAPS